MNRVVGYSRPRPGASPITCWALVEEVVLTSGQELATVRNIHTGEQTVIRVSAVHTVMPKQYQP